LPSTGPIVALQLPNDIRVDSGVEAGGEVTPYYDAMIAKLIAHAPTRAAALDRLADALDRTLFAGVRSNVAFLANLCRAEAFRRGKVDTGFIDGHLAALGAVPRQRDLSAAALGVAYLVGAGPALPTADDSRTSGSPWAARDGFQLGGVRSIGVPILIDGESAAATVEYRKTGPHVVVETVAPATDGRVFTAGDDAYVLRHGRQTRVCVADFSAAAADSGASDGVVKAPMHGKVLELLVGVGDRVTAGQRLAVIEAMKMEHTLRAPFAGVVTQVSVGSGAQVVEGARIMMLEPGTAAIK
jgi:3-methylcrotonyl-CoA carboxylase alpha subunit